MIQFQAGYYLDVLSEILDDKNPAARQTLETLSVFDVISTQKLSKNSDTTDYFINFLLNFLNRGAPTRAGFYQEKTIARLLKLTRWAENKGNTIKYIFEDTNIPVKAYLFKALHIIDPRISDYEEIRTSRFSLGLSPEGFEDDFLFSYASAYLGKEYPQLLELGRKFGNILEQNPKLSLRFQQEAGNQAKEASKATDFSMQLPYSSDIKGVTIEIDSRKRNTLTSKAVADLRNKYSEKIAWMKPVRVPTYGFSHIKDYLSSLRAFCNDSVYLQQISQNYRNPLYANPAGLQALQLALSPIAAARIQRTLLALIQAGKLTLEQDTWKIAVIERDVPAAFLAIEDFKILAKQVLQLSGSNVQLPQISLTVFSTPEFIDSELNNDIKDLIRPIDKFRNLPSYDVVLDVAVLERSNESIHSSLLKSDNHYIIRSAHHRACEPTFEPAPLPGIESFVHLKASDRGEWLRKSEPIVYFWQNLCRQHEISDEDIELVEQQLLGRSMIANYNTPQRKLHIAVLLTFLQPGATVIWTPNRSGIRAYTLLFQTLGITSTHTTDFFNNSQFALNVLRQKIEAHKHLIYLLTPDLLLNERIAASVEQLHELSGTIILDEIQRSAEWHPNQRKIYGLFVRLLATQPHQKQILGFGRFMSYKVLNELRRILQLDYNQIIDSYEKLGTALRYRVFEHDLEIPESIENKELYLISKHQVELGMILYQSDAELSHRGDGRIVLMPFNSGMSGVTDLYGDGIGDKLQQRYKDVLVESYLGEEPDGIYGVNIEEALKSESAARLFATAEGGILVANQQAENLVPAPRCQQLVYFSVPYAMENFLSLNDHIDKHGQPLQVAFNKTNLVNQKQKRSVDELMHRKIIDYQFYDEEKFLYLIDDIFGGHKQSSISEQDYLLRLLREEYHLTAALRPYPETNAYQIFISQNDLEIGYLDQRRWTYHLSELYAGEMQAHGLMQFVREHIKERIDEDDYFTDWLPAQIVQQQDESIESLLENAQWGDSIEATFRTNNSVLHEMAAWLEQEVSPKLNHGNLYEIYHKTYSYKHFVEQLVTIKVLPKNAGFANKLRLLYNSVREERDTMHVLHTMLAFDLVKSIKIKSAMGVVTITLVKQKPDVMLKKLEYYMLGFIAENRVATTMNLLLNELIDYRLILKTYIRFNYRHILPDVENQTRVMRKIPELIAEEQQKERVTNTRINNFVNDYFKYRYANTDYADSLQYLSQNLQKSDDEVWKKWLSLINYHTENWYQLYHSSRRLMENRQEHALLPLFNATVALLMSRISPSKMREGMDMLGTQLLKIRKQNPKDPEGWQLKRSEIYKVINEHSKTLKKQVVPLGELKIHNEWLADFNTGFLTDYDEFINA